MNVESAEQTEAVGQDESRPLGRTILLWVFILLLAFTAALVAFSVPAGVYAVFSGRLSSVSYLSLGRPYFWIGPFVAVAPFAVSAGAWFLFLTAVYCVFIVYSLRQGEGPLTAIRASLRSGFSSLTASPFLVAIIATAFLIFSASIIDSAISSAGVPIGGPTGDPLLLLVGFTAAPLIEGLGFRMLLIGLVALILSMGRPWKDALRALWRPSKAVEGLAVASGASIIIWAATGFSAVTFGACHVVCGSTWDIGKFPEAAYGGLVLGILYVKYGFHVSVLVHWGVDYFGSVYAFFGQAAYGIPWASGTQEFFGQFLVDVDMLLLFGLASFLLVVYLVIRRFVRQRAEGSSAELDKGLPQGGTVGA